MFYVLKTICLDLSISQQIFRVVLRIDYVSEMKPQISAGNLDAAQYICGQVCRFLSIVETEQPYRATQSDKLENKKAGFNLSTCWCSGNTVVTRILTFDFWHGRNPLVRRESGSLLSSLREISLG